MSYPLRTPTFSPKRKAVDFGALGFFASVFLRQGSRTGLTPVPPVGGLTSAAGLCLNAPWLFPGDPCSIGNTFHYNHSTVLLVSTMFSMLYSWEG